ncbi:HdeD family acid-resistance protein [Loktanella sp. S4079]|uniref:HdeD family acid-resistance protein n=1 Tax=Loktanella sp. S4079 TaxID=579483 RepID=UPI0005F9B5A8|nr:DUF308 domain-containing protein [Loktanella sp. S4079]KJZ19792.1 hypothetical protein TW80_02570 [Loktanella sp. S4079]
MSEEQHHAERPEALFKLRREFRNAGYVLIALGALAILFPLFFSIAAKVLLGWLFLLTGAALLYHAFQAKHWESALWSGAIAVMHLALGVYLAFFALTGLIGLTILLGGALLIQGMLETYIARQHRGRAGARWLVANGVITLLLGVLLIVGLPGTALWAIGVMLGVNFLTTGLALVILANHVSDQ